MIFNKLPPALRAVVNTDIKSIVDKDERMAMAKRINELRRERIRSLATPQAAPFCDEDRLKIVPMCRTVEGHFWDDVFHKVPMGKDSSTFVPSSLQLVRKAGRA